ncbi:hypothetical protein M0G43_01290 [Subsaxibacter sp. CAU 1640]|uniref:hypothetical protein n=1 Tax=Subsaxibacter sp. CAU 1640 TaxID=2933271 RepID=UPI00200641DB|nr:hypothetical protein [Subsaxibacter sp. CAU 1640]MCK7589198.1 hypothetical protein [Subsaxibacter sp. CAU 1640]
MKTIKILFTFTLLFTFSVAHAQFPKTESDRGNVAYQADQLTERYNSQLALTGVQLPLFKEVVEKYIKLADDAKARLDGKAELDALVELQARETLQMNDILTQPQYRLYKKLKYDYQPLKVVDPKDVKKGDQ